MESTNNGEQDDGSRLGRLSKRLEELDRQLDKHHNAQTLNEEARAHGRVFCCQKTDFAMCVAFS